MYYSEWSVYKEVVTLERLYLDHLLFPIKSRLTVVSCEVKKEKSKLPKTKCPANYYVTFTQAKAFVI